jgi:ABC-type glycerol-3-phosphate transport system substrate-binding protein
MSEMDMSRRSLLKTAAGVAVVASMGSAAPVAAAPAETAAAAVSAPLEHNWMWYAAREGGEVFNGPYGSREEAIACFTEEHTSLEGEPPPSFEIVEAHQDVSPEWAAIFDDWNIGGRLAELVSEQSDDTELNPEEDPLETVPQEDWNDLAERLNTAARAWFVERGISKKMNVWCFQGQRNREVIRNAVAAP